MSHSKNAGKKESVKGQSVRARLNLTTGGCGQNLGLLGGSPCIHTTNANGR